MFTKSFQRAVKSAAAVTVLAVALAACGGASASDGTAGTPVDGGTLTFYDPVDYAAWKPTNSLWSNSQVSNNLAERLIWQDPETGEYRPWLAESYQVSDDHLSYTFTLKSGVTFSDGTALNAGVVKANFDQHGIGDAQKGITVDPFWTDYAGTDVVDDRTVVVKLAKPNVGFIQILSNYRASSILGQSLLDRDLNGQSDIRNWVGTGPFVVESVNGTSGVTLARRDDYNWAPEGSGHSGPAYLEKIVFKTVPEAGTRVGALQSGEAQIARNIAPYDEETVTAGGGVLLPISVQGETNDLTLQLKDPEAPTQDKRVRLALQAATDRTEINQTVLSPNYPVPSSALVQGTPLRGDSSSYLTYDLDKAKSLLDEAGWKPGADGVREKDGKRLAFHLRVAPYYQVSQSVLEVVQSQWRKAGVDVTLTRPSLTEYESQLASAPDWYFTQGQTSTAEPSVLRTSYGSDRQNGTKNFQKDEKFDQLLAAQSSAFDPNERKTAIQAIEDHIFGEGYSIPLYDETQVFGLASSVHGFATESTGRSWFYDTWVSQ
ncbi:ABC transporter substrate-binding protein [Rhodococcus sp. ACPA4]|uniref:ABC transporter substrate-binding protein n=1 Tax=unclassified Rhodococcus (in: high G+C Gram-positive bacteria) TaxID=192944 RepID=UPI000BB0F4CC|nr:MULTISPECIES: ABC transporter substrate-binding protein [unclassified Rhodococcus (in: high G+C Gram-positive bacteria)]NRI64196.1 ABC transporter substrate-binding protein [Rhodococcus sp. MS16]PBC40771.1 ABC transporter substrate-binding protein [Rhodococcus sp. ACPA4]